MEKEEQYKDKENFISINMEKLTTTTQNQVIYSDMKHKK